MLTEQGEHPLEGSALDALNVDVATYAKAILLK